MQVIPARKETKLDQIVVSDDTSPSEVESGTTLTRRTPPASAPALVTWRDLNPGASMTPQEAQAYLDELDESRYGLAPEAHPALNPRHPRRLQYLNKAVEADRIVRAARGETNTVFMKFPESAGDRQELAAEAAREASIAESRASRGIQPAPAADGTPALSEREFLDTVDVIKHFGHLADKPAAELVNGWIVNRYNHYVDRPQDRPRLENTSVVLRKEWGLHYESNLGLVRERFQTLFPNAQTRARLEKTLGNDPDFLRQIYALVVTEFEKGPAPQDVDEGSNESREAIDRRVSKALDRARRLGVPSRPLFTIQ